MAYKSQTLSSHSTYSFLNRYVILADSQGRQNASDKAVRIGPLGRAIISFAIFVTLFLGILMLFGMGMSRLGAATGQTSGSVTRSSNS